MDQEACQEMKRRIRNHKPSICQKYMIQRENKLLDSVMIAIADILMWIFPGKTISDIPDEKWVERIRPISTQSEAVSRYLLEALSYIAFSHVSENIQMKLNYKHQILLNSKNLTDDEIQTLTILRDSIIRSIRMMDIEFFLLLCLDECTRDTCRVIEEKCKDADKSEKTEVIVQW